MPVLVADAHRMVRDALRALVERRAGLAVCGEAGDGAAALAVAAVTQPELALIDTALPGISGFEVVRRLRRELRCRCVLLSVARNGEAVRQALEAGAFGLLEPGSGTAELLAALEAARAERRYLAPALRTSVAEVFERRREPSQLAALTRRQRDVLRLIAAGFSTHEIAARLGIRARTVETHREKLMARIGIHKAAGLVRYAIRAGLIEA